MISELSIGRVSTPWFSEWMDAAGGRGWIVDAYEVRFSDGAQAVHATYSFASEAEANQFASDMRRKMT
jgi:hypothetical protein